MKMVLFSLVNPFFIEDDNLTSQEDKTGVLKRKKVCNETHYTLYNNYDKNI